MNNRTLLIIAGLALPVIALAIVVSSSSRPVGADKGAISAAPATAALPPTAPAAGGKHPWPTLDQARAKAQDHLKYIQSLSDQDWPQELKRHPHAAKTRQGAIKRTTKFIDQLNAMTPQQWDEKQRKKQRQ